MTTPLYRIAAFLLCACFCAPSFAAPAPLAMVTGPKTGTYFAVGNDIAQVAQKSGIAIDVKSSEGSVDNIKRINGDEHAALGIVQSDVLGFLKRSKSPDAQHMASTLRMVFPLYKEEVHVLARNDVHSFADLAGKKIAVGEDGSGNMLTAINLLAMMRIVPAQSMKMTPEEGVVAVLSGQLDAVVFVGGKPVRLFKNIEDLSLPQNQKFAAMLQQVHFLPLNDPRMMAEYRRATITHADYDFVHADVPTISVQAVLVTYDFSHGNPKNCSALHTLSGALRGALPELQKTGHPKWKEVNFDADPGLWKKDACSWARGKKSSRKKVTSKHHRKSPVSEYQS